MLSGPTIALSPWHETHQNPSSWAGVRLLHCGELYRVQRVGPRGIARSCSPSSSFLPEEHRLPDECRAHALCGGSLRCQVLEKVLSSERAGRLSGLPSIDCLYKERSMDELLSLRFCLQDGPVCADASQYLIG